MIEYILTFIKYWSIFELINWGIYLLMYINIINPTFMYYKKKDTEKIIKRIDRLLPTEIEYVLKGCILYDKKSHREIDLDMLDIKDLSVKEIIYLIAYSLFNIDYKSKYNNIEENLRGNNIVARESVGIPPGFVWSESLRNSVSSDSAGIRSVITSRIPATPPESRRIGRTEEESLQNFVPANLLKISPKLRSEEIPNEEIDIDDNILNSSKYILIYRILKKIEKHLNYKFKCTSNDRYIYRQWGCGYICFNFRPLMLQMPIRIILNTVHYYMIYYNKYNYCMCSKTKIGFLYKKIDPLKKNLLFIHGFGFGYIPYIYKLLEFDKKFNLIIIILPNISSYNYYDELNHIYFPSSNDIKDSIYNFISTNKYNNINLLSHSFGTYITQILRNDVRSMVFDKIIMIDPIIFWIGCFKMSTWVEASTYAKPYINNMNDNLLKFIIYNCMYLKYVCHRVMFGPDFWIYDSNELDNTNVMLVLEKGDMVIPAELLYNKIKNNKIKFHYIDDINAVHGSIFFDSKYCKELDTVLTYFD